MEQNMPVIARKFWNIVRVAFFMLRKGISKRKLMLDLNMMMKRGKIAGKAIHNLMFHHAHSNWSTAAGNEDRICYPEPAPGEYEFSCSNSPALPNYLFPFGLKLKPNKKKQSHHSPSSFFFPCAHLPPTADDDQSATVSAVMKALEMMSASEAASPALPGFGHTPMVRQLRITDSPFPLRDAADQEDCHVDEAAEEFINKFYRYLRQQNGTPRADSDSG